MAVCCIAEWNLHDQRQSTAECKEGRINSKRELLPCSLACGYPSNIKLPPFLIELPAMGENISGGGVWGEELEEGRGLRWVHYHRPHSPFSPGELETNCNSKRFPVPQAVNFQLGSASNPTWASASISS